MDVYAEWAPNYPPRAHNALMQVEQAAVLELLPPVTDRCVLDAGCGTGRYASLMRGRHAGRVVGVDCSAAMLQHADAATARVRADLRSLPFADAAFDVIVSGLVLMDIPELRGVVGEWRRVLKTGGVVVYSTLHPIGSQLGWTRTFATPYGARSLPSHWHTLRDHRQACASAGLLVEDILEPRMRARDDMSTSVALVVRARRTG